MGNCKWCQDGPTGTRSHLIPRWALKHMTANGPLLVFRDLDSQSPTSTRSQSGEYDTDLLCTLCESRMAKIDDKAAKIWQALVAKSIPLSQALTPDGEWTRYVEFPTDRWQTIKRFVLSVAWRLSQSSRGMCRSFSLDEHDEIIRNLLDDPSAITKNSFPIWAARLSPFTAIRESIDHIIIQPMTFERGGRRFAMVSMPRFSFRIGLFEGTDEDSEGSFGSSSCVCVVTPPEVLFDNFWTMLDAVAKVK